MRRGHYLSMSRLALAHLCSWSFREDAPQSPRPAGAEARVGSLVHKMAETFVKKGFAPEDFPNESPTTVAAARELFSAPLQRYLESVPWAACEIGLRYDARSDTTSQGPRRGDPGYEDVSATEIPGTLDLVASEPDLLTVVDLKSGKLVKDIEQLIGQGVAAARHYGAKRVRVGYLYARKTKCDEPSWTVLDEDALDEHAGRLSRLMRRLPMAEPNPGDHCWRCDARPSCPAYESQQTESLAGDLEEAGFFG